LDSHDSSEIAPSSSARLAGEQETAAAAARVFWRLVMRRRIARQRWGWTLVWRRRRSRRRWRRRVR